MTRCWPHSMRRSIPREAPPLLIRVLRRWRASRLMAHPSRPPCRCGGRCEQGAHLPLPGCGGPRQALAEEAATSRLWAGASYPSDVEAGLALGQEVGKLAEARGRADGSDATWDGSGQLKGEGYWEPTPPRFVENQSSRSAGLGSPGCCRVGMPCAQPRRRSTDRPCGRLSWRRSRRRHPTAPWSKCESSSTGPARVHSNPSPSTLWI